YAHLQPADGLRAAIHAAVSQRCGGAETVADAEEEPQQRYTRGQQSDQVGDEEGAAAGIVGDVGETPNVAQAHGRANRRHEEYQAGVESLAGLGARVGGECAGWGCGATGRCGAHNVVRPIEKIVAGGRRRVRWSCSRSWLGHFRNTQLTASDFRRTISINFW